jgi:hypothetical protein
VIPIETNDERDQTQPNDGGADPGDAPPAGDAPNDGDGVPAESLEQGSEASTYVDNPDKPDPSTVAQIEKLPDES